MAKVIESVKSHELKVMPCYFEAIAHDQKKFEIRNNSDRGFQKGDHVYLREYDITNPDPAERYTGAFVPAVITYVTNYEQKPEFVVFGFEKNFSISRSFKDE